MNILDRIKQPVEEDLKNYGSFLKRYMTSDSPYVGSILDYIFDNRGKGIRPLLTLLTASMHLRVPERGLGPRSYLAAMLIEMIHTASLVHDDVIDESDMRRGKPSVNARWSSRHAVIAGDYILAKGFSTGLDSAQYDIVSYIMQSMSELCEGELIQSDQSKRLEMTRETYFDIIYRKTATLIGTSCGVGALSVGATREQVATMKKFGDYVGLAFQIRDDMLDYDTHADTGKPSCNDLKEKKITLPFLCLLETVSAERRVELLRMLSESDRTPAYIEELHEAVVCGGGLQAAEKEMHEYLNRAVALLADYPDSAYRDSLVLLTGYVADREK